MKPAEYAKAIVGGVVAGLTALGTAMAESGVTAAEWVGIAVVALGTFGTVFATPNADPLRPRRHHRMTEGGQYNLLYVLGVIFIAVLLVWVLSAILPSLNGG